MKVLHTIANTIGIILAALSLYIFAAILFDLPLVELLKSEEAVAFDGLAGRGVDLRGDVLPDRLEFFPGLGITAGRRGARSPSTTRHAGWPDRPATLCRFRAGA